MWKLMPSPILQATAMPSSKLMTQAATESEWYDAPLCRILFSFIILIVFKLSVG